MELKTRPCLIICKEWRSLMELCHGWLVLWIKCQLHVLIRYEIWYSWCKWWQNLSFVSPTYYIKRYKQQKWTWKTVRKANKFSKMSIAIFFNILRIYSSVLKISFEVVALFKPSWNVSSFTQFGGSFHCLNFDKFRDTAPLNLIFCFTQLSHSIFEVIVLCFYFDLVTVGTGLTLQVL